MIRRERGDFNDVASNPTPDTSKPSLRTNTSLSVPEEPHSVLEINEGREWGG